MSDLDKTEMQARRRARRLMVELETASGGYWLQLYNRLQALAEIHPEVLEVVDF